MSIVQIVDSITEEIPSVDFQDGCQSLPEFAKDGYYGILINSTHYRTRYILMHTTVVFITSVCTSGQMGSDYINASFIEVSMQVETFIIVITLYQF